MKTIGFISNKLTLRGTEVNLFDYADYNEKLLGNKSIIITRPYDHVINVSPRDVTVDAYNKFITRFSMEYYYEPYEIEEIVRKNNIDVLYIEKAGSPTDGLVFNCCKTIIHAVFTTKEPHGDLYAPISEALNKICGTNYPVLPYMVRVFDTDEDLRNELGIPKDAIVFGSYSGADEYTNEDVKQAVSNICINPAFNNIYFIYLNIDKFGPESPNLKFIPGTVDMRYKRMFINSCDAMLYARNGGETFGLACGEFSVCNKPVIACPGQHSNAHEVILADDMIKFHNYDEVYDIITSWPKHNKDVSNNGYKKYSPENVMMNFQKHLLLLFNPTLKFLKNKYDEKYLAFIDDQVGQHIQNSDRFSPTEITFLEQYITENDNIIEGGANIGSHTIPLSKLNKNGKFFCFEPQSDIFDILQQNIYLNKRKNVIPYKYALGEDNTCINYKMSSVRYDFNRGGFTIPDNNMDECDSQLNIKPITDFNDIISLENIKLIKLDIEGYEPIVLRTMKDLINKHKPILFVEYNHKTFNEITNIIKSLDYSLYYFNTLCSQYNQCLGKNDETTKLCDINLVCFPNNLSFNIPSYLVKINDESTPNTSCYVTYNEVVSYINNDIPINYNTLNFDTFT